MPYKYVKAVCWARTIGSQWTQPDLRKAKMSDIFAEYSNVYLVLDNETLGKKEIVVDLNQVRGWARHYQWDLEAWLNGWGDAPLEETSRLPDSTIRFAKYANAMYTGYRLSLCDRTRPDSPSPTLEDMHDLAITKQHSMDGMIETLHTHCLITVGGFIHDTDTDGKHTFAIDAGKVLHKIGQAHVGILSFLSIGAIQKVRIKPEAITRMDEDTPMFNRLVFSTDVDLTNKSVMLVLGGYLVMPATNIFTQIGDNSFSISPQYISYIERFLESRDVLDMSSLGLTPLDNNPDAYSTEQLTSDEVIRKYFSLSQSFLVVVDTPKLNARRIALRNTQTPGSYSTVSDPVFPLLNGYGRMPGYWKTRENGSWKITVGDSLTKNFVSRTRELSTVVTITNFLNSTCPANNNTGYLLEISTAK